MQRLEIVPDYTKSVLSTKKSQACLCRRLCRLPLHGLDVLAAAMFSILTVVVFVYSMARSISHCSTIKYSLICTFVCHAILSTRTY